MSKYTFLIFLIVLICNAEKAECSHIVGGEINYECLGEGTDSNTIIIKISYFVYTECDSDLSVPETRILRKWDNNIDSELSVHLDSIYEIEDISYPCTNIESDFCYLKYYYTNEFEFQVSTNEIFLEAQVCCRDEELINLENNFSGLGAVHIIDLSVLAQEECNTSPIFAFDLPASFCKDEFFELNLGATDIDNDQVIYELCSPLNSVSDFEVIVPDFPILQYDFPDFGPLYPLGQGSFDLDPNTGLISGSPTRIGSYVVGICATEYRNGQYLGRIRRDIQINITNCSSIVNADIQSYSITDNGVYVINSCNNQSPTLVNLSSEEAEITDLIWSIDMLTHKDTYTVWAPTLFFETAGTYFGQLILNPDEVCSDSLDFLVNVAVEVQSVFEANYDTCVSGPVQFYNNSYSIDADLIEWEWKFGDSTFSNDFNPIKYYDEPGAHEVLLTIIDEFNCRDSVSQIVDWRPAPAVIFVSPDIDAGCAPLETNFNNLSWPIDSSYIVNWNFGDGSVLFDVISPTHHFVDPGTYSVGVTVESPLGCYVDTLFDDLVIVDSLPIAQFNYNPNVLTNFDSEITLIDQSERTISWQWIFDNNDYSYVQEPVYNFIDTGLHTISLIVSDIYNCKDTLTRQIDVVPQNTYFLPNAFSPNGDGVNDVFESRGFIEGMNQYNMQIYNKWGQLIFHTTNPKVEWRGYDLKTNKIFPFGVYVYSAEFFTSRGERRTKKGVVTLVK